MRTTKLITILIAGFFLSMSLTSCKNGPSEECAQLEKANKQLIANLKMYETTWNEIINNRKIEMINDSNFDANITLVTRPENIVGINDFKDYYNNYLVGFSNVTFTISDIFGQGDKIVKHWNFKGTHTGDFFGIPATGKEVNVDGVTLVTMKDGKILQEQDFFDNLEFMQQLGLIPR